MLVWNNYISDSQFIWLEVIKKLARMEAKLFEPLNLCEKYLDIAGLQQDTTQSLSYRIRGHLMHIPSDIFIISLFITLYKSDNNFMDQIAILSFITSGICFWTKQVNYFQRIRSIKGLMLIIKEIVRFSSNSRQRRTFRSTVEPTVKLLKFLLVFVFANLFLQISMIPFKALFCKVYYPFDIDDSWIGFGIAAVHQIYAIFYVATIWNLLDAIPIIFMIYAVGLLDELIMRIDAMEINSQTSIKEWAKCMEIYQLIREYVKKIQQNFGIVFFIIGSLNGFTICSSIFTISKSPNIPEIFFNGVYCIPMMFEMFVPCYVGQRLIDSSTEFIKAFQNLRQAENEQIKNYTKSFQKTLIKPLQISLINGLFNVNMNTFKVIIISSYLLFIIAHKLSQSIKLNMEYGF